MHLIRIFLPLADNDGHAFPPEFFRSVESELIGRFGGVTAHLEAPASGRWRSGGSEKEDDIVIFEVILEQVDRDWWAGWRTHLERQFRQKRIMLTLQEIETL